MIYVYSIFAIKLYKDPHPGFSFETDAILWWKTKVPKVYGKSKVMICRTISAQFCRFSKVEFIPHTPPKTNGWNLKITFLERKNIFQTSILGVHVSFRGDCQQVQSELRDVQQIQVWFMGVGSQGSLPLYLMVTS